MLLTGLLVWFVYLWFENLPAGLLDFVCCLALCIVFDLMVLLCVL